MEKFRKHHCWPKPTIGRIRTVRECDFVGGVGPIPVYPVTSTKAIFNEKNENLEDILNNGIKFQDSVWIKNLYTTKIVPYIADGDTAEGKSYITFNPDGNLDVSLQNKTAITVFENDKELIYTKLTPDGIFIYNDEESSVITKIAATESEFNSIKIHSLTDNDHNIWCNRIAGISDEGKIGEVALGEDLKFDDDYNLIVNWQKLPWQSLPLGTGLSFDNEGKLNCTVKVDNSGNTTTECTCKIVSKYTNDTGTKLFTFNGNEIYGPKYPNALIKQLGSKPNKSTGFADLCDIKLNDTSNIIHVPVFNHEFTDKDFDSNGGFLYSDSWEKENIDQNGAVFYSLGGFDYFNFKSGKQTLESINGMTSVIKIPLTRSIEYPTNEEAVTRTVTSNVGTINVTIPGFGFDGTKCTTGYIGINPGAQAEWNKVIKESKNLANYVIAGNGGPVAISSLGGSSSISIQDAKTGSSYNLTSTDGTNIYKHNGISITDSKITANAFYQTSDERLKENIKDIDVPLEVLLRIPTVNFNFKDKDKLEMGTVAQEVEKICPEIINTDGYGYKSVDYSKLSILALKGLKDLAKRVNELEKLIDKLV